MSRDNVLKILSNVLKWFLNLKVKIFLIMCHFIDSYSQSKVTVKTTESMQKIQSNFCLKIRERTKF